MSLTMSLMHKRNKSGPRMDPCGTPHEYSSNLTVCQEELLVAFSRTDNFQTWIEDYQRYLLLLIYKEGLYAEHGRMPC